MQEGREHDDCPICLHPMESGAGLIRTSCGHTFHINCLLDSLDHRMSQCPLCRAPVSQSSCLHESCGAADASAALCTAAADAPAAAAAAPPPVSPAAPQGPAAAERLLLVQAKMAAEEVASSSSTPQRGVVTLRAPVVSERTDNGANAEQRAGVDLAVVVDASTSTTGAKIWLLVSTLHYLLTQLGPNDRVAIVSIASRTFYRLRRVTEQNREALDCAVTNVGYCNQGRSDVWVGLKMALAILAARTTRNAVSSVLLFTDGRGDTALQSVRDNMGGMLPEGCSVNTFGFGADHDAQLCADIARLGSGRFTFIQESKDICSAVAVVLGGLLSVLAQSIEVQVLPEPGVTVASVRTLYKQQQTTDGFRAVHIPEISEGESRDIGIELLVPRDMGVVVAHVRVKYTDPTSSQVRTDLVALRVPRSAQEADPPAGELIDLHFLRLEVVTVLEFAADLDSVSAKATLQHMINEQAQGNDCPICLQPMAKGVALFQTACGHTFHFNCLKDSVNHQLRDCPLCRAPVSQITPQRAPAAAPALPQHTGPAPQQHHWQQQQQAIPLGAVPPFRPAVPLVPGARIAFPAWDPAMGAAPAPIYAVALAANVGEEDPLPPQQQQATAAPAEHQQQQQHEQAPAAARVLDVQASFAVAEAAFNAKAVLRGVATLRAPVVTVHTASGANTEQRAGVDVVAVVDTSGSMSGAKIRLLVSTLHYLLTQLGPSDRIALVSFASTARALCGLRRVTEQARATIDGVVDTLRAGGGTDIWAGLNGALAILAGRTTRNAVSSVLLLTDGQDDRALQRVRDNMEGMLPAGCSVNTFGYGADHDAQLCADIARLGNGRFTFVSSTDDVGPAFATVLGGLLSVLAQSIEVQVLPEPGVTVVAVRTKYRQQQTPEGVWTVHIPDIYEGERRDVCIELELPRLEEALSDPQVVARVRVSYTDPSNGEHKTGAAPFLAERPPKVLDAPVNEEIELQFLRLDTVDALERATTLANAKQFGQAKAVLQEMINKVKPREASGNALTASLLSDLADCYKRVSRESEWATSGRAFVLSSMQQQCQQRSTAQPMAKGVALCQTSCGHTFHRNCLRDRAHHQMGDCPLCRGATVEEEDPLPEQQQATVEQQKQQQALSAARVIGAQASFSVLQAPFSAKAVLRGVATLRAPVVTAHTAGGANAQQRAGVDVVAVVDTSSSMRGDKKQLLVRTLHYLLTQLGPSDRIALVSFASTARALCGLRRITEQARAALDSIVDTLKSEGDTDIWAGLNSALTTLAGRTTRNAVSSVLLLTDGQDNTAMQRLCADIARLGNGRFTFASSTGDVGPAFATVLGGLLSVLAQSIEVQVLPEPGVTVVAVRTKYRQQQTPAGDVYRALDGDTSDSVPGLGANVEEEDPLPHQQQATVEQQKQQQVLSAARVIDVQASFAVSQAPFSAKAVLRGVATLRAPEVTAHAVSGAHTQQRAGVDVVAVVDTSSSMRAEKIRLLVSTLHFLLTQLGPGDRIALVSFASTARALCGLRRVTEQARAAIDGVVDTLRAGGGTDIWAGLNGALAILAGRTTRNAVSSVLLLTDGQDDTAMQRVRDNMEGMLPEGCSVNTFGYGLDHDAQLCADIARLGNGRFIFVSSTGDVGPAFATVLGGLLSVLAQSIEVQVLPEPGVTVVAVRTKYRQQQTPEGVWTVHIPDIYEGERRDVCIELELPRLEEALSDPQVVARVRVSYTDPSNGEHKTGAAPFLAERPPKVLDAPVNEEIELQFLRLDTVDALERATTLANTKQFWQAEVELREMINKIKPHEASGNDLAASLLSDLDVCCQMVDSFSQWQQQQKFPVSAAPRFGFGVPSGTMK
eukprot:m51a1_g10502 hypothetical protein (1834) ;mRNA; f:128477-144920